MTDFTSPRVVIRPALPRDKADVAEFTKFIWDGHDYVGMVFPRWLEDPHGQLLVAEYAGHCVGTAKVTLVAPGQWWLEGFRVDPNFQDRKIGSQLDAACNEWWDAHGNGVLRFLTSSKRVKVHHLSESRGYTRIGEVYGYEAEPLVEPTESFTLLKPEEVDEAVAFCQRVMPKYLLGLGWIFAAPNPVSLSEAADDGLAFWWRGRMGFLTAWEDDDERGNSLKTGFAACAVSDPVEMLTDFRRLASARGAAVTGWLNAVDKITPGILEQAGYRREWENAGYLYERFHP
jgi:GNAT superfamily N-acetyltransferase